MRASDRPSLRFGMRTRLYPHREVREPPVTGRWGFRSCIPALPAGRCWYAGAIRVGRLPSPTPRPLRHRSGLRPRTWVQAPEGASGRWGAGGGASWVAIGSRPRRTAVLNGHRGMFRIVRVPRPDCTPRADLGVERSVAVRVGARGPTLDEAHQPIGKSARAQRTPQVRVRRSPECEPASFTARSAEYHRTAQRLLQLLVVHLGHSRTTAQFAPRTCSHLCDGAPPARGCPRTAAAAWSNTGNPLSLDSMTGDAGNTIVIDLGTLYRSL